MLGKLLKNKKVLIVLILILLVVVGLIIGMFLNKGSKESSESGKSNANIKTEQNNDAVKENDEDEGSLEDMEVVDESTEDKTDVSGSWETTGDNRPNDNSTSSTDQNNSNQNDSNQDDNNENDNNGDKDSDESGDDIIEDDKTWGEVF